MGPLPSGFYFKKFKKPGYELVSVSSILLFHNHMRHKILSQWFIVYCLEWDTQLTATLSPPYQAVTGKICSLKQHWLPTACNGLKVYRIFVIGQTRLVSTVFLCNEFKLENIYFGINFCGKNVCGNFYLRGLIFADRWKNRKTYNPKNFVLHGILLSS